MSLPILTQVYDEVRRLAIAGSMVAGGDFRLKKLIPALEQTGTKAPVFAKVAQLAQALIDSTEQTSAEHLLELSTLVNAIRYTQGTTGLAGELAPIETNELAGQHPQARARVLKPLLEALTSTGSSRLELIAVAYQNGTFQDVRLVSAALTALDDPYPELADFIANKVLPLYGTAILPAIRAQLNLKGKAGHVRRLRLLHRLAPEDTRLLLYQALDEGSKEIKVAAISCLGSSPDDLSFLLEQAKSTSKEVRVSAFNALRRSDAPEALAAFKAAFSKADPSEVIGPLRAHRHPEILRFLLDEAETAYSALFSTKKGDKPDRQFARMEHVLNCFDGRDDQQTEKLLLQLFADRHRLLALKVPQASSLLQTLLSIMARSPLQTREALAVAHASIPTESLGLAFHAAVEVLPRAEVFDLFSPYLTGPASPGKKGADPAAARRKLILAHLGGAPQYAYSGSNLAPSVTRLDPRWLDLIVEQREVDQLLVHARPGHAAANALLEQVLEEKLKNVKDKHHEIIPVVAAMIRVQHPRATEAFIAALKKFDTEDVYYYVDYYFSPLIKDLPKSAVPQLEALLPTLSEKNVDALVDHIPHLKNRPA